MSKLKSKKGLIALCLFLAVLVAIIIIDLADADYQFSKTFWSLVPPLVAIALALITKEVYSSLFAGIVLGAVMASKVSFTGSVSLVVVNGLTDSVAGNAGIFVFLVLLGIIVALLNKAGASRAFGRWAKEHIHSKLGAVLATFALGVLIFIDDYFNCLTVGSVMNPVTDSHKISRVKMAYIIDATAAPICMIAPVSSWAAAVSGYVDTTNYSGIELFVRAIPFNFYSLLTIGFVIMIAIMGFDYGKMASFEIKAEEGDLSILGQKTEEEAPEEGETKKAATIWDLVLPIIALIVACVIGLLFDGGFFNSASANKGNFVGAFGDTDATVGLPWGCILALLFIIVLFILRKLVSFSDVADAIKEGFVAMVPAIIILTLATSLKSMTALLDSEAFVKSIMEGAGSIEWMLPAVVFVIACVISFATGTSWGTFGILIPIVAGVFAEDSNLFFIGISACLAGSVCGDHCSPISDTTIMASAGAQCNHIDHVETQLPYALSVAGISFVMYIIAGLFSLFNFQYVAIPLGFVLTFLFLFIMKKRQAKKAKTE